MTLKRKIPLAIALAMLLALLAGGLGLFLAYRALSTFHVEVQGHVAQERAVLTLQNHFKTQVQEWKNVLLRGSDAALLAKHWKAFEQEESRVREGVERLQAQLADEQQRDLARTFLQAHARMAKAYRDGRDKFEAAGFEASVGDLAVRGVDREPTKRLDELAEAIARHSAEVSDQAYTGGRDALRWSVALMLLAAAGGVAVGWRISRAVVRPLLEAIGVASAVAEGQLHLRIETELRDETGELLRALSHMQGQLTALVGEVRERAEAVSGASREIAAGNADLSARTEQQAAELQQAASSVEQLGATVRRNAEHAAEASHLARSASEVAGQSGERMEELVRTMRTIQESSRRVVDIIAVIDGIAFQTNILALNAAVEAARAGEQGRGFAVVAGEVRSLAARSAEAAQEVRHLIGGSNDRVEQGAALVDQTGGTLASVVRSIAEVSTLIHAISRASAEQSEAMDTVGRSVSRMDQGTQQNAALVEQTSAAAESLSRQAQELVRVVQPFRLA